MDALDDFYKDYPFVDSYFELLVQSTAWPH